MQAEPDLKRGLIIPLHDQVRNDQFLNSSLFFLYIDNKRIEYIYVYLCLCLLIGGSKSVDNLILYILFNELY